MKSSLALAATLVVLANACGDSPTGPGEPHLEIAHVYGKWGIWAGGEQELVLTSADGSSSRTLLTFAGSELNPEWSPDGRQILFARYDDDRAWFVDEDGRNAHAVDAIRGLQFRWSPDGQWILYLRLRTGGPAEIVVVRPNGRDERVVVPDAVTAASWSPDGRIAFRPTGQWGIWTIRPDGTGRAQLTSEPGDDWPRWSPDGSRLLIRYQDDLMVMDADGSNRRRLTTRTFADYYDGATWSPDGQWVLFARHSQKGYACGLYKVAAGGGEFTVVVPEKPDTGCQGASWRR